MTNNLPMKLSHLPNSLPLDGAVRIEPVEEVPIFRASSFVQGRIQALLIKQKESGITVPKRENCTLRLKPLPSKHLSPSLFYSTRERRLPLFCWCRVLAVLCTIKKGVS